jgi:hypothetical protein
MSMVVNDGTVHSQNLPDGLAFLGGLEVLL